MKKIQEILLLNFLSMDCQKIHSLFTIPAYPSPPPMLACPIVRGPPRRAQLLAPMPHAAMEHPGHARVPTLSMGLVRPQAIRADWTAEIERKNREERKFHKAERYEFQRFDFRNILEGRLYLFSTQHGFFLHRLNHQNFMILKIHLKICSFFKFSDIKNGPFGLALAPKGAQC